MLRSFDDTCIRPRPDFEQLRKVLLREGRPDHVPFYELFANLEIIGAILGKNITDRADTVEFYYGAGYDYLPVWPQVDLPGGSLIDRSQGYPIKDRETFEQYKWPDPASIGYQEFEAVSRMLPEGMKMVGQTGGVFEKAEQLVGYEQLCFMLADDPDLVQVLFDQIKRVYVPMYRDMASIPDVGACVISDDLGFKTQTMISVNELRRYVLPIHRKLSEVIHAAGKPCILHSCGQLAEIMEEIIEDVHIDAKHSYEDAILPVTEAKKLYGDRIAILGGFDVDRLCRSSEEEVREHTRMLVEMGRDGGYALGSGNSIAAFVPVGNYLAMLDEGWHLRNG
jgi:uroporphyrinogen decarboxylase